MLSLQVVSHLMQSIYRWWFDYKVLKLLLHTVRFREFVIFTTLLSRRPDRRCLDFCWSLLFIILNDSWGNFTLGEIAIKLYAKQFGLQQTNEPTKRVTRLKTILVHLTHNFNALIVEVVNYWWLFISKTMLIDNNKNNKIALWKIFNENMQQMKENMKGGGGGGLVFMKEKTDINVDPDFLWLLLRCFHRFLSAR